MKTLKLLTVCCLVTVIPQAALAGGLVTREYAHNLIDQSYEAMSKIRTRYRVLKTDLHRIDSSDSICDLVRDAQIELEDMDLSFRNLYVAMSEAKSEGKYQLHPYKAYKTAIFMAYLRSNVTKKQPSIWDNTKGYNFGKFCSGFVPTRFSELDKKQQKQLKKQLKKVFGFSKKKIHRLDKKGFKTVLNWTYDKLDNEPRSAQVDLDQLCRDHSGNIDFDFDFESGGPLSFEGSDEI